MISSANGTQVLLPNWQQISFGSLPAIQQSGSFNFQGKNRTWKAGQTPDQYLTLGDIQALRPDLLGLASITGHANLDLKTLAITSFPQLYQQTLKQLVEVVPSLGQFSARQVPPIAALLASQPTVTRGSASPDIDTPLANLLAQKPNLGNLQLNAVDLSKYSIADIPNIGSIQLGQLVGWQNTLIADIPGLNALPLASFPAPTQELGSSVAQIDMIWGKAEHRREQTISGSDVAGFSVPCRDQECPYIELNDLNRSIRNGYESLSWISGKYQQVAGGWGCLKGVNGGKEPTGRLPFGSAFKVVVWEPDERTDTVDTALFFRFQNFCGASPYIIGPVPFISYHRDAPIFLGTLDDEQMRASSIPEQIATSPSTTSGNGVATPATASSPAPTNQLPTCNPGETPTAPVLAQQNGIDVVALSQAIAKIPGVGKTDAGGVGPYVCELGKSGNCGFALGQYQTLSYEKYTSATIAAKPGGLDFLKALKGGHIPSQAELFQFLPPADQQAVLQQNIADQIRATASQIDPKTGQFFTGERLIERVAQSAVATQSTKENYMPFTCLMPINDRVSDGNLPSLS